MNRFLSREDIKMANKNGKMLTNISHQGNANPNDNRIPFHIHHNGYKKRVS